MAFCVRERSTNYLVPVIIFVRSYPYIHVMVCVCRASTKWYVDMSVHGQVNALVCVNSLRTETHCYKGSLVDLLVNIRLSHSSTDRHFVTQTHTFAISIRLRVASTPYPSSCYRAAHHYRKISSVCEFYKRHVYVCMYMLCMSYDCTHCFLYTSAICWRGGSSVSRGHKRFRRTSLLCIIGVLQLLALWHLFAVYLALFRPAENAAVYRSPTW